LLRISDEFKADAKFSQHSKYQMDLQRFHLGCKQSHFLFNPETIGANKKKKKKNLINPASTLVSSSSLSEQEKTKGDQTGLATETSYLIMCGRNTRNKFTERDRQTMIRSLFFFFFI
jgi:hypothetical protein